MFSSSFPPSLSASSPLPAPLSPRISPPFSPSPPLLFLRAFYGFLYIPDVYLGELFTHSVQLISIFVVAVPSPEMWHRTAKAVVFYPG